MRELAQTLRSAGSKLRDSPRWPRAPQAQVTAPPQTCSRDVWGVKREPIKEAEKELSDTAWNLSQLWSWKVSKTGQPPAQLRDSSSFYSSKLPTLTMILTVFLFLLAPSSASSPHPAFIASPSTELVSPGPAAVASCPGNSHTSALERELTYEIREEARVRNGGGREDTGACAGLLEWQSVTECGPAHTTHTPICLLSLEGL